jgi:hypothetical protein
MQLDGQFAGRTWCELLGLHMEKPERLGTCGGRSSGKQAFPTVFSGSAKIQLYRHNGASGLAG